MQGVRKLAAALLLLPLMACGEPAKPAGPNVGPGGSGSGDSGSTAFEIGKTVPAWQKGEMDIHFINTTSGESMFIIFPDGTQMLIDAASSAVATNSNGNTTNSGIRSRWDPTKSGLRGSQIIGAYINKCMEWTGNKNIDYAVVTHLHNDHIGGYSSATPKSTNSSTYYATGMAEILDNFQVDRLLDRGYPAYNYPFDMAKLADNAANCASYINAVKWHVANKGLKAELFKAGSDSQIALVRDAASYPGVKVRNIAVNGEIWTGIGSTTNKTFPSLAEISYANSKDIGNTDNCPPENINSCVMKISYGKFDFFAGGDLQFTSRSYFSWKDAEMPCARVCGKVEVMKANHHGTLHTNQADAMTILQPQVHVTCSWMDAQPRTSVLAGMEKALPDCKFYITNFWTGPRADGVDEQVTDAVAAPVVGRDGHVLVRVARGGDSYRVAVLSDSDGKMNVKSVSGEFKSR